MCKQKHVLVNIDLKFQNYLTFMYDRVLIQPSLLLPFMWGNYCSLLHWALNTETESWYDESAAVNHTAATMHPGQVCLLQIGARLFFAIAFSTRVVQPAISRQHRRIFVWSGPIHALHARPCTRTQDVPRLGQVFVTRGVFWMGGAMEWWRRGEKEVRHHGSSEGVRTDSRGGA